MEKDPLHVFIVVRMPVSMIMTFVPVVVSMSVVSMAESSETDNVDEEAEYTNNQKFIEAVDFVAFPQALKGIKDDFYTDKSGQC